MSTAFPIRGLVLALETSNPSANEGVSPPSLALGESSGGSTILLGVESVGQPPSISRADGKGPTGRGLMPSIEALLNRLGKKPRDLRAVAVSIGPGGFTGLRVAIVTAKMIAEATGAACIGVPSACVVARRVASDGEEPYSIALASKGETTFLTRFRGLRLTHAGVITSAQDLTPEFGRLIADKFLPVSMRERAAAIGLVLEAPTFDAAACLEAACSGEFAPVDPAALLPMYPREPEAVTKWRVLHPQRAPGTRPAQ